MNFDNGEYSTTFNYFNTIPNYYDNDCYYDTRER